MLRDFCFQLWGTGCPELPSSNKHLENQANYIKWLFLEVGQQEALGYDPCDKENVTEWTLCALGEH